jgi:hypothetical protein
MRTADTTKGMLGPTDVLACQYAVVRLVDWQNKMPTLHSTMSRYSALLGCNIPVLGRRTCWLLLHPLLSQPMPVLTLIVDDPLQNGADGIVQANLC